MTLIETTAHDAALPKRRPDTHKGDYGRALIVAGSVGFTGAPSLAAKAAVRMGAGLVFLYVPDAIYTIEAVKNDEAMVFPLPSDGGCVSERALPAILQRLEKSDACLIGPGLGLSDGAARVVEGVVENSKVPLVIDADGITHISRHIDILKRASCPIALTPHEGEFRRLLPSAGAGGRAEEASAFASEHGCVLVRKGHRTLTAFPDGTVYVNTTGNPGMAKGGSGDVLAGMLTALIAEGLPVERAAAAAVYLHGLAGDIAAAERGEYAMTPSDMIERIGGAVEGAYDWEKRKNGSFL